MKNEKESRNLSKNNITSISIDFKDIKDDDKKLNTKKSITSDTTVISKKNIQDSLNKSISNFRLGAIKIEKDSTRKKIIN